MLTSRTFRSWLRPRTNRTNSRAANRLLRTGLQLQPLEERAVPALLTVTDPGDTGANTLRGIMNTANTNGQDDTIQFSGVTAINLTTGQISYTENFLLTINGAGVTVNGAATAAATNRIFSFNVAGGDPTITINGLTMAGGNLTSGNNGGAILTNNDPLVLSGVTFSGNKTAGAGGAISVAAAATITISNSTFSGNSSTGAGGAINLGAATTLGLTSCTFTSNIATGAGGAVSATTGASSITVDSCTFTTNKGSTGGALIASITATTYNLKSSTFDTNSATSSGGALYAAVQSTWQIDQCQFLNNKSSGVGGAVRMTSTTPTFNVNDSTFSGNSSASTGGAIYFAGSSANTFTFNNSTFSNNIAATSGGGIHIPGSATYTFNNCTFSGNLANGNSTTTGGGALNLTSTATLNINNSTLAFNTAAGLSFGGGIRRGTATGVTNIISTIVAKNAAGTAPDMSFSGAVTVTGGSNLVGVSDAGNFTLDTSFGSNQIGFLASPLDPVLGPLQDNGGATVPHTFTRKLESGSPGVNTGNQNGLALDQTGAARPASGADIGAVESNPVGPIPPTAKATLPDVTSGGGTVYTATVVYTDDTAINTGTIDVNDVTLSRPGFGPVSPTNALVSGSGGSVTVTYDFIPPGGSWDVLDGGTYSLSVVANQVFDTDSPTPASVKAGTIGTFKVGVVGTITVDNTGDADDGNVSAGQITLREAIRIGNTAVSGSDTINFSNAVFSGSNTINLNSSGIGTITISTPMIITGPGSSKLTVTGSNAIRLFTIDVPSSSSNAISMSGMTLTGGNSATGSAINVNDEALTLNDVTVTGNATSSAVYVVAATGVLDATDCTFSNNSSSSSGGAIRVQATGGQLLLTRCTVSGNSSTSNGGGVYFNLGGTATIDSSTFSGNQATSAGGGLVLWNAIGTITNSTFANNKAGTAGGAIELHSTTAAVTLNNSTVTGNSSTSGNGGGIARSATGSGTITLNSTLVAKNTGANGPDLWSTNATTIYGDFNLIGVADKGNITISGGNNKTGNLATPLDPLIGPLNNYGGKTQTVPLQFGSPALDVGDNSLALSFDQRGSGFPRVLNGLPDIGAFEGTLKIPVGTATAPNVNTSGATTYVVTVQYTDETGINTTTIDLNDITVTGPNGYIGTPTGKSFSGPATNVAALYTFTAPNNTVAGAWDLSDNGTYTINIIANQVFDTDAGTPNAVSAGAIGSFKAVIPVVYTVNSTADAGTGSGNSGDLRYCITQSNANGGADLIVFDSTVFATPQTITVGTALSITDSLTITGPGSAKVTVTAAGKATTRVFTVDVASSTGNSISISGMTITGGNMTTGAAINDNDEALSLNDVTVTGNIGSAAVYLTAATASMIATDCVFSNNTSSSAGGAIRVNATGGSITLTRCTVTGNSCTGNGGGVYFNLGGTATIDSSTFSNNVASTNAGAILFWNATGVINNSTFVNNKGTAGGAFDLHSTGAAVTLNNCTVYHNTATGGNGGGLARTSSAAGVMTLNSTIVSGNTGANGPDVWSTTATTAYGDFNLIGVADLGNVSPAGGNNQMGSSGSPLDALLADLNNYGGTTQTLPLMPGSPALNAGSNTLALSFDQRGAGYPRVLGGQADVGAFEGLNVVPTAKATAANVVTAGGTTYSFTVTYLDDNAINLSSLNTGDVTVSGPGGFTATPAFVTSSGSGGSVTATYSFTPPGGSWDILDDGAYTITMVAGQVFDLDGTPHSVPAGTLGTFTVAIPGTLVVDNIGDVDDGDLSAGKLTLREAVRVSNTSVGGTDTIMFAPALNNQTIVLTSELKLSDGVVITGPGSKLLTISGNAVGRIFNINDGIAGPGTFSISGLSLTGGKVTGDGGAIFIQDESVSLTDVSITGNSATIDGGGINLEVDGGSLTLINCNVSGNAAGTTGDADGGGINIEGASNTTIKNSTIANNTCFDDGGGILFQKRAAGHTVLIENTTISGNVSNATTGGGGGINFGGTFLGLTIRNSTISGNTTKKDGGGLQFYAVVDPVTIQNTTIAFNSATVNGGGINQFTDATGTITMESCIVSDNNAATGSDIQSTVGIIDSKNDAIGSYSVTTFFDSGGNIFGQPLLLSPLGANGGSTQTIRPAGGSPVVNAGSNPAALSFDQRGTGFPRQLGAGVDIGSFEVDTDQPYATIALTDIFTSGGTKYTFTVTYADDVAIDVSTIGTGDVTVAGPGGFAATPTMKGIDFNTNGTPRVVTYEFIPPGTSWDTLDNGSYAISLGINQVKDTGGKAVPDGVLGSFKVAIPVTVVVDHLVDENDGIYTAGNLSLREAILLSNGSSSTTNLISFAPSLFSGGAQTLTMSLGAMTITKDVTIQGPGANKLTIDGALGGRIFTITDANTSNIIEVTISGMTLTNGKSTGTGNTGGGGAIYFNAEHVTLDGMEIMGNTAATYGGAVFGDTGALTVLNSSLHHNIALTGDTTQGGGAIQMYTSSDLTIKNSTLAFNKVTAASSVGGAIVMYAWTSGHVLTIENSTITANTAVQAGGVRLFSTTTAICNITSSIISGNVGTSSQPDFQTASTPTNINQSLIGSNDGLGAGAVLDGYSSTNLGYAVQLGALQNNGGPTSTMALLATNTAGINDGTNPSSFANDQRGAGYVRAFGAAADIGAFEVQAPAKVSNIVINGGAIQRSRVLTIQVNFNSRITLPVNPADAFTLVRQSDSAVVALSATVDNSGPTTSVTLTFLPGAAVQSSSLADGKYTLGVIASMATDPSGQLLDGDGNGSAGGDYSLVGTPANKLFRLYGDADGNAIVDGIDFGLFRGAFNTNNVAFDFDGSGVVDGLDFGQFRSNFNKTIV